MYYIRIMSQCALEREILHLVVFPDLIKITRVFA